MTIANFNTSRIKSAVLGVALFLGASAASAYGLPVSDTFTDAKTGFVVKVSEHGSTMVLNGFNPTTKETFALTVTRGNEVSGTWRGQPVSYVLPANLVHNAPLRD